MHIKLLGRPSISDAKGEVQTVRGNQAWAVLARVLLSARPLSRRVIAQDILPDAEDPLGALRWVLASLRRALGSQTLQGDPVEANLPAGTRIDVMEIGGAGFDYEAAGELLEGLDGVGGPEFATWLLIERERLAARIDAALRQEAMRLLAEGRGIDAADLAGLGARRRPFDEGAHVLLIRALVASGLIQAAEDHVARTETVFLRELGISPGAALRSAARPTVAAPPQGVSASAMVETLILSGNAALAAGAVDAGIDCLRRAVLDAEKTGDRHLQARGLTDLGIALIQSVRGHDDEGAINLRIAAELGGLTGDGALVSRALQYLAYAEALAGRRPEAARLLEQAEAASGGDVGLMATILAVRGFNLVDWGEVVEGLNAFEASIEAARGAGDRRREVWALGLGGWGHLLAGNVDAAMDWSRTASRRAEDMMWVSFRPWPLAVLAEARLRRLDDAEDVRVSLEEPFALSCRLGDPCWEAATGRVLALAEESAGRLDAAWRWIVEAERACSRASDIYTAVQVATLGDRARIALLRGERVEAEQSARRYLALAARTHADAHLADAVALLNKAGQ